jgi:hypothetical protein
MDETKYLQELQRLRDLLPASAISTIRRPEPGTLKGSSHPDVTEAPSTNQAPLRDDAAHRVRMQKTVPRMQLIVCNELRLIASMASGQTCRLECANGRVNFLRKETMIPQVWLIPKTKFVILAVRLEEPVSWLCRLRIEGLSAYPLMTGGGVQVCVKSMDLYKHATLLGELITDGIGYECSNELLV